MMGIETNISEENHENEPINNSINNSLSSLKDSITHNSESKEQEGDIKRKELITKFKNQGDELYKKILLTGNENKELLNARGKFNIEGDFQKKQIYFSSYGRKVTINVNTKSDYNPISYSFDGCPDIANDINQVLFISNMINFALRNGNKNNLKKSEKLINARINKINHSEEYHVKLGYNHFNHIIIPKIPISTYNLEFIGEFQNGSTMYTVNKEGNLYLGDSKMYISGVSLEYFDYYELGAINKEHFLVKQEPKVKYEQLNEYDKIKFEKTKTQSMLEKDDSGFYKDVEIIQTPLEYKGPLLISEPNSRLSISNYINKLRMAQ